MSAWIFLKTQLRIQDSISPKRPSSCWPGRANTTLNFLLNLDCRRLIFLRTKKPKRGGGSLLRRTQKSITKQDAAKRFPAQQLPSLSLGSEVRSNSMEVLRRRSSGANYFPALSAE